MSGNACYGSSTCQTDQRGNKLLHVNLSIWLLGSIRIPSIWCAQVHTPQQSSSKAVTYLSLWPLFSHFSGILLFSWALVLVNRCIGSYLSGFSKSMLLQTFFHVPRPFFFIFSRVWTTIAAVSYLVGQYELNILPNCLCYFV